MTAEVTWTEAVAALRNRVLRTGGIDLTKYKEGVVLRRLANRMKSTNCPTLPQYLRIVDQDPREIDRLLTSITIQVSSFFRDMTAFTLLEDKLLPEILAAKSRDPSPAVRIWSAGCAHGEEAYTLAIILRRARQRLGEFTPSILATDVNPHALRRAQLGEYEARTLSGLTQQALAEYFEPTAGGYRVKPALKEMIRFKIHDLLTDPIARSFDVVVCRNVLIYLNRDIQEEVLVRFHSLLRPGGYLILGKAETLLGGARTMYETISLKARVFRTFAATKGELP